MKSAAISLLLLTGVSSAQVDCVQAKLKLKSLCGVVTAQDGQPIPNAQVTVGWADVGTFERTDDKGRWGFDSKRADSGWIQFEAAGFRTERFSYESPGSASACKKPVYIRLVVGGEGCPVVTFNAKQGIKR